MSLNIKNIVLHYINKKESTNEVELNIATDPLEISERITDFVDSIHTIYNSKGSKAYGGFDPEKTELTTEVDDDGNQIQKVPFAKLMDDYLNSHISFAEFTTPACFLLKSELEKYELSETGYLLMCHYEMLGGQYFIVALLPVTEHYYVDGKLNISADQHLDTAKLQLAVRIDLVGYEQQRDDNRYVSFIKGRAGRKVNDFFLDFLGCQEGVDPKSQSQLLVKAVEDYVDERQLAPEEGQKARKELLNYCKEQKDSGQEVSLKELSHVIEATEEPENGFYGFCQKQDYEIEEEFPHDQAVINKVTKYSGYGNGISISFERSHFGSDVIYNPMNDTLTIHKVPPNLKDQLLKLLSTAQED